MFPPGLFLELRGFTTVLGQRDEKRPKENKKKNIKPFCTLVVARLSSSEKRKSVLLEEKQTQNQVPLLDSNLLPAVLLF